MSLVVSDMRSWYRCLIVCLICLSFCISTDSLAEKPLFSFCYEKWMPYAYLDDKGEATGGDVKRIQLALSMSGRAYSFVELPFARCLKEVKSGQIDFALHVDIADGLTLIEHPLSSWDLTFAYRKNTPWRLSITDSNDNKRVLIARDYNYPKEVKEVIATMGLHVIESSYYASSSKDEKMLFKLLDKGFVDAMLVDKVWAQHKMKLLNLAIELDDNVISAQPQFIGYINSNKAKATILHKILKHHDASKSL